MSEQAEDTRPHAITFIPLNKLQQSEANARRTDKRVDIEALAEDIAAHGLLQNLNVTECGKDRYAVSAGGRRHAALKLLAKQGRIAKDVAIPCKIVSVEEAAEISLAENIQRVAMNVMDEVDAFAALAANGAGIDEIARRFGSTIVHVERRLALAKLSPKVKATYRKGEINLDTARAFCITDDHAAQEAVFKQLSKPITNAQSVRAFLTQGRMPAHDRLARFVGIPVYEAAGGRLARDLFEDDVVFLEHADLVRRLAHDKLEASAAELRAKGWGWVETHLGYARFDGCASERLHPSRSPLCEADQTKLDAAQAALEDLENALEAAEGDDPRWSARDQLQAEIEAIKSGAEHWDPTLITHAGVVISIEQDGRASLAFGVIKRADLKAIAKLRRRDEEDTEGDEARGSRVPRSADGDDEAASDQQRLPRGVIKQLTEARTRALRQAVSENSHLALALVVHILSRRSAGDGAMPGIDIESTPAACDDVECLVEACEAKHQLLSIDGAPNLDVCLAQPTDVLLDALAACIAETIDLSHLGVSPTDRALQSVADTLAALVDLDMTRYWAPDLGFWSQVPKSLALTALEQAPSLSDMSEKEKSAMLAAFAKMKKADLAAVAAQELHAIGWLPDLLVTPPRAGAFVVTADGEATLSAVATA